MGLCAATGAPVIATPVPARGADRHPAHQPAESRPGHPGAREPQRGQLTAGAEHLQDIEASGRVAFRYADAAGNVTPEANPNGSLHNIAGVLSDARNVLGMMPHPERACDPLLGGEDGNAIWQSVLSTVAVGLQVSA
jgi:hypothetical protein